MKKVWIATSIVAVLTAGPSCSGKCNLEHEVKEMAGSGAADCGVVPLNAERGPTDFCVVQAFQNGKPFHARYERRGTDSHVAVGVARSSNGMVVILSYDGDPGGGGGDGRPVVKKSACEAPRVRPSPLTPRDLPFECGSVRDLGYACR